MKIILCAVFVFCFVSFSNGQAPAIQWQRCYGGSGNEGLLSIKQTNDGGFILVGATGSNDGDVSGNHGLSDAWAVKVDSIGTIQWQKCYGGSGNDNFRSIDTSVDGGYFFIGASGSTDGDLSGILYPGSNYWIVKTDNTGSIQWQRRLGGSGIDICFSQKSTYDGGCIVIGYSDSNDGDVSGNHGGDDLWVIKLDTNGAIQWQKCVGGSGLDRSYSVNQTPDSGYFIAGATGSIDGDVTGVHGWVDYWVVKLDNGGNLVFNYTYGGTSNEWAWTGDINSNGEFFLMGETLSNNGNVSGNHGSADFWIIKTTADGILLQQKCLGGSMADFGKSIRCTNDNGIIIAGDVTSNDGDVTGIHFGAYDWWVVKLDSAFNIQWSKCIGGNGDEHSAVVEPASDGGYLVTGAAYSTDGDVTCSGLHGVNVDAWVVKLSPAPVGISALPSAITDFTSYLINGNLYLNFYANSNERLTAGKAGTHVQLLDITGRVLLSQPLAISEGFNKRTVHAGELSVGLYLVRLVTEGNGVTKKLIVQ